MESVRYVYIIHCFGMLHMLYVIQQQLLQVQYIFLISVPFSFFKDIHLYKLSVLTVKVKGIHQFLPGARASRPLCIWSEHILPHQMP